MTKGLSEESVVMLVRFSGPAKAEAARATIQGILDMAQEEVDALFRKQGGMADVFDIKAIYARFGFCNDVGWTQEQPIIADGNEMIWEIPSGMVIEEAELLSTALGAADVIIQPNDDDMLLEPFHPLTRFFWDDEPDFLDMEEDLAKPLSAEKKNLH